MPAAKSQSFSRPPWERMMRFHHLIREKSYPNCNKVAKEFEVSWRTIMRDMDFMRDHPKLPIAFDQQRIGYVIRWHALIMAKLLSPNWRDVQTG